MSEKISAAVLNRKITVNKTGSRIVRSLLKNDKELNHALYSISQTYKNNLKISQKGSHHKPHLGSTQ